MPLEPGSKLGAYEVLAPLGAGGMGEVYRARDPKLSRDVAIKVLPAEVARDPERLGRFRREATLLAALNHPHIAAIHGLEEADGSPFLVLELVEGEDLSERLKRGPVPVDEALEIGQQMAEALEEAHEKGIVHRDLKPANVKLTPDGKVKVLDFGLAKAYAGDSGLGTSASDFTQSPTLAQSGTAAGVILGTASYMSPAQASGKAVDKRADIWAFGVVLFEMLTGRRPFRGETVSEVLASVIKDEPDWTRLPAATPPALRKLLRRCLEKKLRRRLQDVGDARLEIEEALHEPIERNAAADSRTRWDRGRFGWAVAALVAAVAVVVALGPWRDAAPPATMHVAINLPPEYGLARVGGAAVELALSPDGTLIVFTAERAGQSQLFLRALDQPGTTPLPGTEGGHSPFFSPDSRWVGFFATNELKKVAVAGGAPVVICPLDAPKNPGASWGSDDTIVFSASGWGSGLWHVSADGGTPAQLAKRLRWPQILPDGKHALATARNSGEVGSAVISLETGELFPLRRGRARARYVPSGHLVYGEAGTLMAVGFDPASRNLRGSPRPVLDGVYMHPYGLAYFSFSRTGALAYVPGRNETTLEWVDRNGRATPLVTEPGDMVSPRVSPDGTRIAVARMTSPGEPEVWVYDALRGTGNLLGPGYLPVWTADGGRIAYIVAGPDNRTFWQPADGSGPAEPFQPWRPSSSFFPSAYSPGVGLLGYLKRDLWVLPSAGDPVPVVTTPDEDLQPALSPDGRWLLYASNETGQFEVYVQQYPGGGRKRRISTDGGLGPVWSPDGREILYRVANGDQVLAVSFGGSPDAVGTPRALFEGDYVADSRYRNYDIAPDGQRFLMMKRPQVRTVNIVLNWFDELKAKMDEVGE